MLKPGACESGPAQVILGGAKLPRTKAMIAEAAVRPSGAASLNGRAPWGNDRCRHEILARPGSGPHLDQRSGWSQSLSIAPFDLASLARPHDLTGILDRAD